jgi:hypothetical protein
MGHPLESTRIDRLDDMEESWTEESRILSKLQRAEGHQNHPAVGMHGS